MRFRVSIKLLSEDGKYSNIIYSHKWLSEKKAKSLAKLTRKIFEFFDIKEK